MSKKVLALFVASAFPFVCAEQACAAAFALVEQGASGLGNAYAGAAAAAEDASTVWWNPAGMSRLPSGRHFAIAGTVISPSTKFSNRVERCAGRASAWTERVEMPAIPLLYQACSSRWTSAHVEFRRRGERAIRPEHGILLGLDRAVPGHFPEIKTLNVNPAVLVQDQRRCQRGLRFELPARRDRHAHGGQSGGRRSTEQTQRGRGCLGLQRRSAVQRQPRTRARGPLPVCHRPRTGRHHEFHYPCGAEQQREARREDAGESFVERGPPSQRSLGVARRSLVVGVEQRQVGAGDAHKRSGGRRDRRQSSFSISTTRGARRLAPTTSSMVAWTLKLGGAYDQTPVPNAESRTVRLPDSDRYWLSGGGEISACRRPARWTSDTRS